MDAAEFAAEVERYNTEKKRLDLFRQVEVHIQEPFIDFF